VDLLSGAGIADCVRIMNQELDRIEPIMKKLSEAGNFKICLKAAFKDKPQLILIS